MQSQTPELRPTTNYLSFDQRGPGQSSHAPCRYEYDPAEGDLAHVSAIGETCSQDPAVATMTTEQTAYDMDFLRHLLGLETVTYLGYSYGTWLGTWYGALFGENIERMVFDSAVDGTADSIQTLYDAAHEGRDRQFRLHLMNWISRHDDVFGLGEDPAAIWERYFAATDAPEAGLTARYAWNASGAIVAFSNSGAYPLAGELVAAIVAEAEAPVGPRDPAESAAHVIDSLSGLTEDQRAAALVRLESLAADPDTGSGPVQATYDEVIDFTKCTDGQWTQGEEHWERFHRETAAIAPLTAQLGLLETPQVCAFWPTETIRPEADESFPETLVLQSELDSMTPFEHGRAVATGLPHTSLIAVDNDSAHGIFPYGTDEIDRPVLDFLRGGERPGATIIAAGKPMPLEERTYQSWSPLDEVAEHPGPVPRFTDPMVPARTLELPDGP
ncbi:alpha/beta hydrolase [Brachybacterium atlanticum]|uniref:alpha/beta hydrolase n=1 Tax=Brachybacterium atlanticum TaxID=2911888 RepID=UPI0021E06DBC|nr:alpha/beta hydrolase [Brachybacterium atlanticum]